jgi:hypothetical protein
MHFCALVFGLFSLDASARAMHAPNQSPHKPPCSRSGQAEQALISADKEYLPISGDASFTKLSAELAFGEQSPVIKNGQVRSTVDCALVCACIFLQANMQIRPSLP